MKPFISKHIRRWAFIAVVLAALGCQRTFGGGVYRVIFDNNGTGVPGATIQDLLNAPNFDRFGAPFFEFLDEAFENVLEGVNTDDGYDEFGSLTHGYIQAPMTGTYTIVIATDDNGELYLGEDYNIFPFRNPDNLIGVENDWTNGDPFATNTTTPFEERSSQVDLVRGEWYFVELLHKENTGGSFIRAAWERPDGVREVIPAYMLAPYGTSSDPATEATTLEIDGPDNVLVTEGERAVMSVTVYAPQPTTFQWFKNGEMIPDATLQWYAIDPATVDDHNTAFSVMVTDGNGNSQTTSEGFLQVNPDIVAPTVEGVEVGLLDPNILTVTFSEEVSQATAEDTNNYQLNNGATVQSAELQADGVTVILTCQGVVDSMGGYQITISGVQDVSSESNPVESVTFNLILFPGGFVEDANGFVVFEVEHYTDLLGDLWEENTDVGTPSGGASMMLPAGVGDSEDADQLLYEVSFNQTGRHIVWYRALPIGSYNGGDGGGDDSAWFHIDGARPPERTNSNDASMAGFNGAQEFEWNSDAQSGADPFDFNLDTAGTHIVGIAAREDGAVFDKMIITTDDTYDPDVDDDGFNRPETVDTGEPLPNPSIVFNQNPQDVTSIAGLTATFSVDASAFSDGDPAPNILIHWVKDGEIIDGANGSTYETPALSTDDDGALYQALVRMPGLRELSEAATLTVLPITFESQNPADGATDVPIDLPAITVSFSDGPGGTIDTGNLSMTLNGEAVTPDINKADGLTTITLTLSDGDRETTSDLLDGNTLYEVGLTIPLVEGGDPIGFDFSFTTEGDAVTVPGDWAAPLGSGATPGFKVRSVQAAVDANLTNSPARAEAQLGTPPVPDAEFEGTDFPQVINYSNGGNNAGFFTADNGFPDTAFEDSLYGSHTEEVSLEIITFLEFDTPGLWRMGANVDDGFRTTVGPSEGGTDLELGVHPAGGGATNADPQYPYKFIIETPGVYAFRMIWWQGNGGASVEWSVKDEDGVSHLLNAPDSPVKAYQSRDFIEVGQPSPSDGAEFVDPAGSLELTLTDGTTVGVDDDTIQVTINGETVAHTVNRDGDAVTVSVDFSASPLMEETVYNVVATYNDTNGVENTVSWSFTTVPAPSGIASIIWISEVESPAGQEYKDLLSAQGYQVTERFFTDPTPAEQAELNAADLVIVSRKTNSGTYNNQTWDDTITTPLILMTPYLARNSRWVWLDGTSIVNVDSTVEITADAPEHPLFDGIDTTGGTAGLWYTDPIDRGTNINGPDPILDGGTLLASQSGNIIAAEWPADTVAVGPRLLFNSGSQEPSGGGTADSGKFDLTETGQQAFLNAVAYMAHPEPFDVIWVSFHEADDTPSSGAAGAGFTEAPDKTYTDLLTINGYNVTRYVTTTMPDAATLNEADVVIVSRSVNSGNYQGAAATEWNGISAPMIIMGGYPLRSSRMGYTGGTTMIDTTGDISLTINSPAHPIFNGIELDANDTMVNPFAEIATYPTDGTTLARGISINTDAPNPDGTVLATISDAGGGPAGGMVIGEWPGGSMLTHDGGAGTDTLAGPRLVFLSGSREASGISSETAGIYDLIGDGPQLFLNAVLYMASKGTGGGGGPGAPVFDSAVNNGDGTITITWTGDGTLEMTPTLSPPDWQAVSGAGANTYTTDSTTGNAFFRVVQ